MRLTLLHIDDSHVSLLPPGVFPSWEYSVALCPVPSFHVWLPFFSLLLAQTRPSRPPPVSPVTLMDNSHGREIHYHLARALMHLNSIAGFLPFLGLLWTGRITTLIRPSRISPHQRQLHTFVPLPSDPSFPSLSSHGGLPTHMVLNPEPHLRPLSISRGPCPIEEPRSGSTSARMDPSLPSRGVGMSTSNTPVNPPDRSSHIPSHESEPSRPKAKGIWT